MAALSQAHRLQLAVIGLIEKYQATLTDDDDARRENHRLHEGRPR